MTTSSSTFPQRLSRIDSLSLPDHSYLSCDDVCYYFGEYSAEKGYAWSKTNSIVYNLKKSVAVRSELQWQYKERDMTAVAVSFRNALSDEDLNDLTFIPVPPSKSKTDPLYDDRMTRILLQIRRNPPLDIRELLVQTESTESFHSSNARLRPEELANLYTIDESFANRGINRIAVVDDMLTTGSHFKAAQAVLNRRFPIVPVIGLFITRRVPETTDPEDLSF